MRQMIGASLGALVAGGAMAQPMSCEGLTAETLGLTGVTIAEAVAVPAGEESPAAQCRVRGSMDQRTGTDGTAYALSFELALPDDWNGGFVHQFNGGNDGTVVPATGRLSAGTGETPPLARGYAVVSSDAGHDGRAFPDAGLAGGARFGFDFEARRDYGYDAVPTLDPVARAAVEAFYGAPIRHAYGVGCSNGGRHGMVALERMPEAFDGVLIGAPGFNLPRAALQHALDVQVLSSVTGELSTGFPPEDLELVADGIRAACDALDGLEDGLVQHTAACQAEFDLATLECREGRNEPCLSSEQVDALLTIHAGPRGEDGSQLYADWAWDTGIEGQDWRMWKLESPIEPWGNLPIIAVMGAASLAQIFTVPPTEVAGDPDSLKAFLMDFDIAGRAGQIDATSEEFPESPMQVMTPPNSDDPTLAAFREAGGRALIYHGVSDPVFSVNDTTDWYERLDANNDGAAAEFVRYYPVPGMNHCDGGPAPDLFDLFGALTDWVEGGEAPGAVTVAARADNAEVPAALAGAERLLCPHPQVATYQGGDETSAASFTCE